MRVRVLSTCRDAEACWKGEREVPGHGNIHLDALLLAVEGDGVVEPLLLKPAQETGLTAGCGRDQKLPACTALTLPSVSHATYSCRPPWKWKLSSWFFSGVL